MAGYRSFSLYKRKSKKGKPVYYCRFRLLDGSRTAGLSTGCTSRGSAERWALERLENKLVIKNPDCTLREFVESFPGGFFSWEGEWATDRRASGKRVSPQQCREKQRLLEKQILPELGNVPLTAITKAAVKTLRNKLFRTGYSSSTINHTLSCLRSVLEAAEDAGLIRGLPKIERVAERWTDRGILTPEEVKALFSSPWTDHRAYTANLLAAVSGLRQGEILALQRQNVRPGYLDILRSWNQRENTLNETTKNGRSRYIPIPSKVEKEIHCLLNTSPWRAPESFVFYTPTMATKPMEGKILRTELYKALENIGITEEEREKRRIDFHSWRHWFNSILLNQKVPLQKVQAITGHLTKEMVQRYYHLDCMEDIRAIQESMFSTNFPMV